MTNMKKSAINLMEEFIHEATPELIINDCINFGIELDNLCYSHPLFTKRMRKKELLKKLREYQSWRKGADIPMMPPSEVTRMIDSAITVIEKSDTSKANAVLFKKEVIDKLHITVGAMILDGYDEFDSCVKYVNDLIRELDEN